MNNPVFLEYIFVFDPSETWQHMSQFDDSFSKFLDSIGLEGCNVGNYADTRKRLVMIKKKPEIVETESEISKFNKKHG